MRESETDLRMAEQTPLYIIASPHPRVGKTLLARLLIEYLRADDRPLMGFDLNPREPTLSSHFPHLVRSVDITDTRGQMELFDQLIVDDFMAKVIDLGYAPFEQFFAVMAEINFVVEARRHAIEPIVLFLTDRAPVTARAYEVLRQLLPTTIFVPVHNEAVSVTFDKVDFPPSRNDLRMILIRRLSPIVRGVIDRPSFSFSTYMLEKPGGPTEIHDWVDTIFKEFRELERRLLMGHQSVSLGGGPIRAAPRTR
jgi:hypothetical protein